jgi:DUF1009 family protein
MDAGGSGAMPPEVARVGLLAGSGRFPLEFARRAARRGIRVVCVGVHDMVLPEVREFCEPGGFRTVGLAHVGKAIRLFKKFGVDRVVMAGKVDKTRIIAPYRFWRLLPDWRTLGLWYRHARRDKKDDTLLLAVVREFELDNLIIDSALDYCPELLVSHGFLTRRKPNAEQWKDIRFGWELAKEMGRLDVGQSVAVRDTAVLAVEAIEGTDACIRRAGELCRRGGFTVVKVAKPQQDRRFDVPTIGLDTIQTMHESGARVLAVEAGKTILLDQEEILAAAERCGIVVVAVNAAELELKLSA